MVRPARPFDWNQARAFLATAEEGSLSAAARRLGQTQPTLGRQVSALEDALGVALFERAGRGLVLTPSGRDLLEHVRVMGEAAGLVSLAAAGRAEEVAGPVSVTATDLGAVGWLAAFAAVLREEAPGVRLEIVASNRLRDLARREADIAIRHVRPEDPSLIARRLRDGEAGLYGATALLDRIGRPEAAADLAGAPLVAFDAMEGTVRAMAAFGLPLGAADVVAVSDSGVAGWEMVRRGVGLALAPCDLGDPDPGVERLLPEAVRIPIPIWLVTHRELRTSRRIRLVFDRLAAFVGT